MASDSSCWETIANTPSLSVCEQRKTNQSNARPAYSGTPFPKQLGCPSTGNTGKSRRWSQSRKVNKGPRKPLAAVNSKRLMLLQEADEQAEAAQLSCANQKNSTVCNGGTSLEEPHINGFSPIKNDDIKSKGVTVVPLKSYLVEHLNSTSKACSLSKVEKWLASTEKHVKNGEFTNPESPGVDFKVMTKVENMHHATMGRSSASSGEGSDIFSPIQSECAVYQEENTLESCIISEMATVKNPSKPVKSKISAKECKNNDSTKPRRKKRRRITMKVPVKKKTGAHRSTKKLNKRVGGKNMTVPKTSLPKPDATLKDRSMCFLEKRYNLRSKGNCKRTDMMIKPASDCLTKPLDDEYIAPDETPPDPNCARSTQGKRKLSFVRKKLQIVDGDGDGNGDQNSTSSALPSDRVDITCCLLGTDSDSKIKLSFHADLSVNETEEESCQSDCLCVSV